jgi:hypothetical protein
MLTEWLLMKGLDAARLYTPVQHCSSAVLPRFILIAELR